MKKYKKKEKKKNDEKWKKEQNENIYREINYAWGIQ